MNALKLNQLEKNILTSQALNNISGRGGDGDARCGCGCHYEDKGGSSIEANMTANWRSSAHSGDDDITHI